MTHTYIHDTDIYTHRGLFPPQSLIITAITVIAVADFGSVLLESNSLFYDPNTQEQLPQLCLSQINPWPGRLCRGGHLSQAGQISSLSLEI